MYVTMTVWLGVNEKLSAFERKMRFVVNHCRYFFLLYDGDLALFETEIVIFLQNLLSERISII